MKKITKICLGILLFSCLTIVGQNFTSNLSAVDLSTVDLNSVNVNDEIIDDNSIETYSGSFIIQDGNLVFKSDDCTLKGSGMLLKSISGKSFKTKKWIKKVKKEPNKEMQYVLIKGVKSSNSPVIFVKKVTKPLKKAKSWSGGSSYLYLTAAQELYKKTIELRENYDLFSVDIEEVDDPVLGKITEYTLYDSKCNKMSPDDIKKMSDKELNSVNNSLKIGGGLLLKQAALTGLAALSTQEIATASMFQKVTMGKDAITAGVFQAAIIAQLPKIVSNLKESKKYIDQLKAE
ncbi:hypothetical protein H9W90_03990 [Polaribacter pectinis]|uniref:Uncharacterized protein n=1 Tax=Polaribacter pectinis TaxID=2738844 RepID=A0A7G9LCE2_9FLAO|nr:hypothetical protein [Polaribacter pectinis]QNM86291.1 hypothetical protein H9W90_03990 [Polaribacter pectinis]